MCTFLAAGQVIRRMQFNWRGLPTDDTSERASAFSIIFTIVCVYFTIHFMLVIIINSIDPNFGHEDDKDWVELPDTPSLHLVRLVYMSWSFVYWVGSTIVLINTRRSVRQRYGIPAEDFEDCLCGVFCHCCVVSCLIFVSNGLSNKNLAFEENSLNLFKLFLVFKAGQLLRHTTDYDVYPSNCFSDTGLPPHVPAIV
jgi:Cys-rich protein (TIGR01571 family)